MTDLKSKVKKQPLAWYDYFQMNIGNESFEIMNVQDKKKHTRKLTVKHHQVHFVLMIYRCVQFLKNVFCILFHLPCINLRVDRQCKEICHCVEKKDIQ